MSEYRTTVDRRLIALALMILAGVLVAILAKGLGLGHDGRLFLSMALLGPLGAWGAIYALRLRDSGPQPPIAVVDNEPDRPLEEPSVQINVAPPSDEALAPEEALRAFAANVPRTRLDYYSDIRRLLAEAHLDLERAKQSRSEHRDAAADAAREEAKILLRELSKLEHDVVAMERGAGFRSSTSGEGFEEFGAQEETTTERVIEDRPLDGPSVEIQVAPPEETPNWEAVAGAWAAHYSRMRHLVADLDRDRGSETGDSEDSGLPDAERQEMVRSHLPLVLAIARRYARGGEEFDDLVEAGSVGLVRASTRFDPGRGVAFGTFVAPAVEGAIRRRLTERGRGVREAQQKLADDLESLWRRRILTPEWLAPPAIPKALDTDEAMIVLSMAEGLSDREITDRLSISQEMLQVRLQEIMKKLAPILPPAGQD